MKEAKSVQKNVCPNKRCEHYIFSHTEGGCCIEGCECTATRSALELLEKDRQQAHNKSGFTQYWKRKAMEGSGKGEKRVQLI